MSLNPRQQSFLNRLELTLALGVQLAEEAPELVQQHTEEFASGQDNDLSANETDLAALGHSSADINAAVNQFMNNGFMNMWEGNAVPTREYGKDCRRVAKQS